MSTPVAQQAGATWQAVDAALAPIIGLRAVAALQKRSLQVAGVRHPGLSVVLEADAAPGDHAPLRLMLSQLPNAAARAAEQALTEAFQSLLTELIGGPLARQLLPFLAWPDAPGRPAQTLHSGPAAQESPP